MPQESAIAVQTASRFTDYIGKLCLVNPDDPTSDPMEGEIVIELPESMTGLKGVVAVLRFHHGYLWGINEPAVECTDTHTEYWERGIISCKELNFEGKPIPAIQSMWGRIREWWLDGKQLKVLKQDEM